MKQSFRISVSTNEKNGDIFGVYFQIRKGRAAEVREFADGAAFANYAKNGELLGIELLAPCKLSILDRITPDRAVRSFIKKSVPRQMAIA